MKGLILLKDLVRMPKGSVMIYELEPSDVFAKCQIKAQGYASHSGGGKITCTNLGAMPPEFKRVVRLLRVEVLKQGEPRKKRGRKPGTKNKTKE